MSALARPEWRRSGDKAISHSRFSTYAAAGAVGTAAQYLVLALSVQAWDAAPVPASLAGYVVGTVINYGLNYHLTFRSNASHLHTAPRFLAIAGLGFVMNAIVMQMLVNELGLHYLASQVVASVLVLCMNYLANSYWTFRHG